MRAAVASHIKRAFSSSIPHYRYQKKTSSPPTSRIATKPTRYSVADLSKDSTGSDDVIYEKLNYGVRSLLLRFSEGALADNPAPIFKSLSSQVDITRKELCSLAFRFVEETSEPDGKLKPGWDLDSHLELFRAKGQEICKDIILRRFLFWVADKQKSKNSQSSSLQQLIATSRLDDPHNFYPLTRCRRRKLILHVGPTNSGKTYNALCALAKARTGVYAAPLRLLAHEVYSRFNSGTIGGLQQPKACSLITGEETRRDDPDDSLVSCTIEMIPQDRAFDVAVIDEIQMLGSTDRGPAWTAALLGIQANEVHLCGEETVVKLVQEIGKQCGDEVIIQRYKRLSPLVIADQSLHGDLTKIRKGDCLVTFSRRNIFMYKRAIEQATGLKVAVVYGSLPPETREAQAKAFNSGEGYDVLVASDAIGMGLNLRIKRMIIETCIKWNGRQLEKLSISQIKQIAGRAGRYGMSPKVAATSTSLPEGMESPTDTETLKTQNGVATTLHEEDLPLLREAIQAPFHDIHQAVIQPPDSVKNQFYNLLPVDMPYAHSAQLYNLLSTTSPLYCQPRSHKSLLEVLGTLDGISGITSWEAATLAHSPVQTSSEEVVEAFKRFVLAIKRTEIFDLQDWANRAGYIKLISRMQTTISKASTVSGSPASISKREKAVVTISDDLQKLEAFHRIIVLYLWLGARMPIVFSSRGITEDGLKKEVEDLISKVLEFIRWDRMGPISSRKYDRFIGEA